MKKLLSIALILLLTYLLAWPLHMDPIEWHPLPSAVVLSRTESAGALAAIERIGEGVLTGPEAIAFDDNGSFYTGLDDGRLVNVTGDLRTCRVLGHTGGRPLGLLVRSDGAVVIADAKSGLISLDQQGNISTLADKADGIAFGFPDDVVQDSQGRIYLSEVSWKYGFDQQFFEVLEHGARGRLVRYDPETGEAVTMLAGLNFANGVALGPDDEYLLINETTSYQVTRFWLKGDKAGQRAVFASNLPGFPDNITFNGRDRFWLALFAPRSAMVDWLAPRPFFRSVIARLPAFLHMQPQHGAIILGLDLQGQIVEQYSDLSPEAYGPITSVREHHGHLYLGSLSAKSVGRISLDELRSGLPRQAVKPTAPLKCMQ